MSKSISNPNDRAAQDVRETVMRNKHLVAQMVNALRKRMYPQWARDVMLCHPKECIELCKLVRQQLPFSKGMDDSQILLAYVNESKRGNAASCVAGKGRRR